MAYTKSAAQEFNASFLDKLNDASQAKEAADAVTDWTRTRIREDCVTYRIQPPVTIDASELDRQLHTDKPVKILDKEPDIPPAISVSYGAGPNDFFISAPKYAVTFYRILSPQFAKDIAELRTYTIDVRQVVADNAIKDMLTEIDTKYIKAWNAIWGGTAGTVCAMSGAVQWKSMGGGIDRNTYKESRKIMPQTQYRLEAATAVINNVSVYEFEKWGRDEWGGDGSEDMLTKGWTLKKWDRLDWIISIKQELFPDNTIMYFADPRFIGKLFMMEEPVMVCKREAFWLSYWMYMELGCTIAHAAGGTRADFS